MLKEELIKKEQLKEGTDEGEMAERRKLKGSLDEGRTAEEESS